MNTRLKASANYATFSRHAQRKGYRAFGRLNTALLFAPSR